jgi:hypothetical protein
MRTGRLSKRVRACCIAYLDPISSQRLYFKLDDNGHLVTKNNLILPFKTETVGDSIDPQPPPHSQVSQSPAPLPLPPKQQPVTDRVCQTDENSLDWEAIFKDGEDSPAPLSLPPPPKQQPVTDRVCQIDENLLDWEAILKDEEDLEPEKFYYYY